jgi:hypothetical protein
VRETNKIIQYKDDNEKVDFGISESESDFALGHFSDAKEDFLLVLLFDIELSLSWFKDVLVDAEFDDLEDCAFDEVDEIDGF